MATDNNLWQQLQFNCRRIKFERKKNKLAGVHYSTTIFYNFINRSKRMFQHLQLVFGEEAPYRATIYRWFNFQQFCWLLFLDTLINSIYKG